MGQLAGDGGRARGELTLERSEMRLEPLYTVTFTTPEACSVEVQPRHREQQDDKDAILLSRILENLSREEQDSKKGW